MAEGGFAGQARALGRPASERRHVGLGPGLVDEDQPRGLDLGLIFQPLRAASGDVGTVLLAGDQRLFLVTELLGMDEFPHRPVVDHETALCQLGHEPPQGEAGLTAALQLPGTVIA